MFVSQSEYLLLLQQHTALVQEWNHLVGQINARGGEAFLQGSQNPFSMSEIRTLIKLCHPDKHAGNSEAEEITRKLLDLRGRTPP